MKTTIIVSFGILLMTSPAIARERGGGFGLFRDFGWFGFGGFEVDDRHGGFGGFGGFGGDFGIGFFNSDRIQTRFENQFDSLKMKYDDGVAGSTDFFSSTEYDNILNKTQFLADRDSLFVSGVQREIDRIPDVISLANDDLTYYNDLLANYQADTSLSPERLDRIEMWINRVTDRISTRIDTLTTEQSTLQTNLPTYQSFQDDLTMFLSDITAAGGGASVGTSSSLLAPTADSMVSLAALRSQDSRGESMRLTLSPAVVPEPSSATLVMLAGGAIAALKLRRSHRT